MNAQNLDITETLFGGFAQTEEAEGKRVATYDGPSERSPACVDTFIEGDKPPIPLDESSAPSPATETTESGLDADLMYLRLLSLQHEAQESNNASLNPPHRFGSFPFIEWVRDNRLLTIGLLGMIGMCCVFSGVASFLVWRNATNSGLPSSALARVSPTLEVFQFPPTWTPTPTPVNTSTPAPPSGKAKTSLIVRSGPGQNYAKLGTIELGSKVTIIGRSPDSKYLAIAYPYPLEPGWVVADAVESSVSLNQIPGITRLAIPALPTKAPVIAALPAKPSPTLTPLAKIDFEIGRPVDFIADCGQPWKVSGTTYATASGSRQNGVMVRITAFGHSQGVVTSGVSDYARPGYWEWSFNRTTDVQGDVTLVNADGTPRSQPIPFRLTSKCDGAGAVTQMIMDFVAKH